MLLFDFTCRACGATFEELVKSDAREVSCLSCSTGVADRQISAPTIDPNFLVFDRMDHRPAIDKWDKKRRKKIAQEKKHSSYHE